MNNEFQTRIESYQGTINKIREVLSKLLSVWNGKAFDKLCIKLNSFFNQVNAENTNLNSSDRPIIINIYKDMESIGNDLSDYKKRLIEHINSLNNNQEMNIPTETPNVSMPNELSENSSNSNTESQSLEQHNAKTLALSNGNAPAYMPRSEDNEVRNVA